MSNNISFLAASGLTFLTERQRTAYLLRAEDMTYRRIGQEMGITASTAREHVRNAERRIREYTRYQNYLERDRQRVDVLLTRGDLREILQGLQLLKCELGQEARKNHKADWKWKEELTDRYQMVSDLMEKIDMVLYEGPKSCIASNDRENPQQSRQMPTKLKNSGDPKKNGNSE